jgi:hypothetical protein
MTSLWISAETARLGALNLLFPALPHFTARADERLVNLCPSSSAKCPKIRLLFHLRKALEFLLEDSPKILDF